MELVLTDMGVEMVRVLC